MRQGNNTRRLRGRPNRKQHVSPRVQIYDSHGPDVRIRGNAPQVNEKYLTLARDATSAGDRVGAESYYQFAEHYFRIMNDTTDPQRPSNDPQRVANEAQRTDVDSNSEQPNRPYGGDEQPHVDWPENANTGNGHDRNTQDRSTQDRGTAERPQERVKSSGSAQSSSDSRASNDSRTSSDSRASSDGRGAEGRTRREPRNSRQDSRDSELPLVSKSRPTVDEAQAEPSAEVVAKRTLAVETKPLPVPVVDTDEPLEAVAETPVETPVDAEAKPRRGRPRTKRALGTGTVRKTAVKATRKTKKSVEDDKPKDDGEVGKSEKVSV